jgi:hypothetical protein
MCYHKTTLFLLEFSGGDGPCSMLRWKSKTGTQAKIKGILFAEKQLKRLHREA